jgi:hypothetical protein
LPTSLLPPHLGDLSLRGLLAALDVARLDGSFGSTRRLTAGHLGGSWCHPRLLSRPYAARLPSSTRSLFRFTRPETATGSRQTEFMHH